jgi:hypothetical protein
MCQPLPHRWRRWWYLLRCQVPTLASTLEVISPVTLDLKGEGMPSHATTLEGAKMMASPVPTLVPTMEVVSPMTLNLKLEGRGDADSCTDAGRFGLRRGGLSIVQQPRIA